MNTTPAYAYKAARAKGSVFLTVFGTAWLLAWAVNSKSDNHFLPAAITAIGCTILGWAVQLYRANKTALREVPDTPRSSRVTRWFTILNVVQWVAIALAIILAQHLGHPEWAGPSVVFIVGLHFMPLAVLFNYRMHTVTGGALMMFALAQPLLDQYGFSVARCYLAVGLVLLASSVHSLTAGRSIGIARSGTAIP